jgi:hypothetical protein
VVVDMGSWGGGLTGCYAEGTYSHSVPGGEDECPCCCEEDITVI